MKKLLCSIGALAALTLAGCGGSNESVIDSNVLVDANFDTLVGWIPEAMSGTLARGKAHSGNYALKVDGTHEYSLGYTAPLGNLSGTRVKKIKVSAWTFLPAAGASATLVVTVGNPATPAEKPVMWEGLSLGKLATPGKWVEVSKVITLPENILPTYTLGLYLWREGSASQPIYLDDLRVTIEP